MLYVPIRVYTGTTPVTGLIKADVVIKKIDDSVVYDYYSLMEIGLGQYVLVGCREGLVLEQCRIWISGVRQEWINVLNLGDEWLTWASLAGTNAFAGTNGYTTEKTLTDDKEFTYKSWVESAIETVRAVLAASVTTLSGLCVKLAGGNTMAGANTFTGDTLFSYGEPPRCVAAPVRSTALVNKSFVQSEISVAISKIISGAYQESPNIIRLIPSGAEIIGSVYLTFQTALAYLNSLNPVLTKQFTILITGEGTSGEYLTHDSYAYPLTSYVKDYVHFRGLGSDIKIFLNPSITTNEFKAGALGRIVIEDLYFYSDDGGDASTQEFENIVFKNCKFYTKEATVATFTNCKFEGINEFSSYQDNAFQFVNCTGSPISIDSHAVAVSGTNLIPYETLLKKKTYALSFVGSLHLPDVDNNSFYLDLDNDNKLSFKDNSGVPYTVNLTAS